METVNKYLKLKFEREFFGDSIIAFDKMVKTPIKDSKSSITREYFDKLANMCNLSISDDNSNEVINEKLLAMFEIGPLSEILTEEEKNFYCLNYVEVNKHTHPWLTTQEKRNIIKYMMTRDMVNNLNKELNNNSYKNSRSKI